MIRAVVLWGRIVKYQNLGGKDKDPYPIWDPQSSFAHLRRQVQQFKDGIPLSLTYNSENLQNHAAEHVANQFLYLHIICEHNLLFLNRFAIPVSPGARPPADMPKKFLSDTGRDVVEAANQISSLIEQAAGHLMTVPFAGYCAYAASTVHVWGIFSKNTQIEATSKERLRHNYKYLNKMKKYWGMFHYMAESVKDIYRRFADAAIRPSPIGDAGGQSAPMFQYGDWFDKYPHGVLGTEWEDSGHDVKNQSGAEAVMSQQSDLQSVEEFFASLSPPSKAEQSRKIAKRHGKSMSESRKQVENKNEKHGSIPKQPAVSSLLPDLEPSGFNPPLMQTPQIYSQAQFNPQSTFNIPAANFYPTGALPNLDRQMVFGALGGLEPTTMTASGSVANVNMWEGVDMSTLDTNGFLGESTSAWFMPFNIDPPEIGDVDSTYLMGEYGMAGSFPAPSDPNQGMDDVGMGGEPPTTG